MSAFEAECLDREVEQVGAKDEEQNARGGQDPGGEGRDQLTSNKV